MVFLPYKNYFCSPANLLAAIGLGGIRSSPCTTVFLDFWIKVLHRRHRLSVGRYWRDEGDADRANAVSLLQGNKRVQHPRWSETPDLAEVAQKVVSQPISSSSAERNWSTFSYIYSVKRNKLNTKTSYKLVYIHSNIWLQSSFSENYKYDPNSKLFHISFLLQGCREASVGASASDCPDSRMHKYQRGPGIKIKGQSPVPRPIVQNLP